MKFKKKSPTQPGNHQEKYDINRWVDKIKNLFTKI